MVKFDESTSDKGSKYVRDIRSQGGRRRRGGGGVGRPIAAGGGLVGVIIAIIFALLGGGGGGSALNIDTSGFDQGTGGAVESGGPTTVIDPDAETVDFMEALMFDIQETWDLYFDEAGLNYEPTTLTIFTGAVDTQGCGRATSAVGPFYCPAPTDRGVYVDLEFFDELSTRFGAPGDFAQAYVIAHEVGHHIQAILRISDAVRDAQARDPGNKNEYSIRQELQADCLAGVWAFSANQRVTRDTGVPIIQAGDIEEGMAAAASVGDDRIQESAGVGVNPHTWTHGSSQQRVRWFRIGFDNGDPEMCDTFAVDNP
ncbi:MAG: neutral zinc metallopeptidase [Actinomycetota bacterium]